MPSIARKVPPPPKEPGTHTNAEVKEALHARAMRRMVLVTAIVFLLLTCLAVVSNTAREAVGNTGKPKLVMLVVRGLSQESVGRAMRSNKSPFMRSLSRLGGQLAYLNANNSTKVPLISLLTASETPKTDTLANTTSILGWLKKQGKQTIVAAPSSYWSLGKAGTTPCPQVGLLDTECSGQSCPEEKESAYCNAFRKYITCNGVAKLYKDDIVKSFEMMIHYSADALYMQLDPLTEAVPQNMKLAVQERSEVNLLDAAVGRLALALAHRTSVEMENWLMIITSDGDNTEKTAPLLVVAYAKGEVVQLNDIDEGAKTIDLLNTVKHWFKGSGVDTSRLLGICTSGEEITNCKEPS